MPALMPRNLNKNAILTRSGPADYQKLASAGFSTPTSPLDVGGVTLNKDTGDKFEWTGSIWVPTHYAGKQIVVARDYYDSVAHGLIPNHTLEQKWGASQTIGTANLVPVATSQTYQTPTTAQALEIVSDDATNDVAAGTGARTVVVIGLDGNFDIISETVALNGTTAVNLVNSYTRIYRMYVATSGTYATASTPSHNSTITVRDQATSSVIWGQITPEGSFGLGQSEIGVVSIPAGSTARVLSDTVHVESAKNVTVVFFVREGIDIVSAPYSPMLAKQIRRELQNNVSKSSFGPLLNITGPADFGFMAKATTGTADVSVEFEYILEIA